MAWKLLSSGIFAAALLIVSNGTGGSSLPQDDKDAAKKTQDADMAKNIALYEKAAMPGEQHKKLASLVGTWDQKCTKPGMTESPYNGTVEYRAVLGGRYVVGEAKGTMTMPASDGKPMTKEWEGFQILAYDNVQKQFQTTWCDSMNTGIFVTPGTADSSGNVITFEGTMKDARTPSGRPFKVVLNIESNDRHSVEIWDSKDGKPLAKETTIIETRKS
jgi:Protein of unknown function (DUF1579)